jgi:hypothetical protein
MEGEKTLCVPGRFESAHLPFPLARRLMRGFDAIVGVPEREIPLEMPCLERTK